MGRFTSVDPESAGADESNPQSWNGYSYALNNPVIFGDPDGLGTKVCDLQGQCHEFTDDEANAGLFNKKWQRENGHTVKGGKIYQNGELIGTYQNTGIDGAPMSSALMEAGRYPYGKAMLAFGGISIAGGVTGGLGLYYGPSLLAGGGAAAEAQFFGGVTRAAIQRAAADPGPTIQVVTRLTQAPQAGRALSVAVGENAGALANAARAGGQVYTANIPKALIETLRTARLVTQSTTRMGGTTAVEYRFAPQAAEFILRFFK